MVEDWDGDRCLELRMRWIVLLEARKCLLLPMAQKKKRRSFSFRKSLGLHPCSTSKERCSVKVLGVRHTLDCIGIGTEKMPVSIDGTGKEEKVALWVCSRVLDDCVERCIFPVLPCLV